MAIDGTNGARDSAPVHISVALAPNNIDAVPKLLEEITAGVEALKIGGDQARQELAIKARDMMLALEAPRDYDQTRLGPGTLDISCGFYLPPETTKTLNFEFS